jgi:hypothetical protein
MSLFSITRRALASVCIIVLAASFSPVTNEVISAIRSGDAVRISKHLDEVVRITVYGKSHAYGRGQGEMILRGFFADRGVRQFSVGQQGFAKDTEFFVGDLVLADDSRYRMSVFMKERSGQKYIQEIRLEP